MLRGCPFSLSISISLADLLICAIFQIVNFWSPGRALGRFGRLTTCLDPYSTERTRSSRNGDPLDWTGMPGRPFDLDRLSPCFGRIRKNGRGPVLGSRIRGSAHGYLHALDQLRHVPLAPHTLFRYSRVWPPFSSVSHRASSCVQERIGGKEWICFFYLFDEIKSLLISLI